MASSVASTASPAPSPSEGKVLKGRDLINIGIFTAIYFVIQFVFMLCGGIHPALWVFMPALDGLFAGIPFMLMCAKVQKPGAVVIMGLIVALIYFATGMFTPRSSARLRATAASSATRWRTRCSAWACAEAPCRCGCSTTRSSPRSPSRVWAPTTWRRLTRCPRRRC